MRRSLGFRLMLSMLGGVLGNPGAQHPPAFAVFHYPPGDDVPRTVRGRAHRSPVASSRTTPRTHGVLDDAGRQDRHHLPLCFTHADNSRCLIAGSARTVADPVLFCRVSRAERR